MNKWICWGCICFYLSSMCYSDEMWKNTVRLFLFYSFLHCLTAVNMVLPLMVVTHEPEQQVASKGRIILWYSSLSWIQLCDRCPGVKLKIVDSKNDFLSWRVSFQLWGGGHTCELLFHMWNTARYCLTELWLCWKKNIGTCTWCV